MSKTLRCTRNVILGALLGGGASALIALAFFVCFQAARYLCATLGWNFDGPLGALAFMSFVLALIGAAFGAGKCWSERNA